MKKTTILFLFLCCMQFLSQAQPIKFRKVIGNVGYDYGYYAEQTSDKGYVIAGSTSSFGGTADMYAIKTDSMGIPYFASSFGGINIEKGLSIKQTFDKGYIFLGYTNSFGAGGYDVYLVKLDSAFNTQWEKTYGGTDWDFGNCVVQTADSGYVICGSTYSYGAGDQDYYLIKTNALGDTVWTKTFGGANEDIAKCVKQTSDGGYVLTGSTKSMGDVLGDYYTIKTDSAGDTIWTNKYGATAKADLANGIIESAAGDYLIAGESATVGAGGADGVVVRLFSNGTYDTYFSFGGTSYDGFTSISQDALGRLAMCGSTNSFGVNGDMLFCILNSDLSFFNATTFGTIETEFGYSAQPTEDNSFILCGHTNGFNNGLDDIYLIKTDTFGLSGFTGSETFFVVGVEEQKPIENDLFSIFPNPAANNVTLNFKDESATVKKEILIFDVLGKQAAEKTTTSESSLNIDISNLANGIYAITVVNEKYISSQKLVVHH